MEFETLWIGDTPCIIPIASYPYFWTSAASKSLGSIIKEEARQMNKEREVEIRTSEIVSAINEFGYSASLIYADDGDKSVNIRFGVGDWRATVTVPWRGSLELFASKFDPVTTMTSTFSDDELNDLRGFIRNLEKI